MWYEAYTSLVFRDERNLLALLDHTEVTAWEQVQIISFLYLKSGSLRPKACKIAVSMNDEIAEICQAGNMKCDRVLPGRFSLFKAASISYAAQFYWVRLERMRSLLKVICLYNNLDELPL